VITPSPEDYGFLQVERPVISGGSEFLAKAALVGRQVLGAEIVTCVTEFGVQEVSDEHELTDPSFQVKDVTSDVMHVGERNDLRVVLLHRSAPAEIASRYSFVYHLGLFAAKRRKVRGQIDPDEPERGKHTLSDLRSELDQISQNHGQQPNNMPMSFDRVAILGEPGKDLVLGLIPKERQIGTLILHRQAYGAHRRLREQSKKLAFPISPWAIAIPFARVPGNITPVQYDRLIGGIESHLPHTLVLGGIDFTGKDRAPVED
jgi:hypothetical protein